MVLDGLLDSSLELIMFGGKGGVGKTTCAASTGLYLAENDKNTVLISTDPAHSLSDSLGMEIGDEIKKIKGVNKLSAIEVQAEKALSCFKARYDEELRTAFATSSYLDEDDISALLGLPIPGIDEVMGFKTIIDLIEEGGSEKYVVDTAPTGHALRLLTLPGLLDDWIKVVAKMRWKYRYMVKRFSGEYAPDKVDDLLLGLKKTVKRMEGILRDGRRCEFIVVTIAEEMAVKETARLIENLRGFGIKVRRMIINNVMPQDSDCAFCRARREGQDRYIREFKDGYRDIDLTIVPLQPHEVRGPEELRRLGGFLSSGHAVR